VSIDPTSYTKPAGPWGAAPGIILLAMNDDKKVAVPAPEPVKDGEMPPEVGGRPGPEPTRYGDWEKDGRCIDF
jgi:hypothetical protein